MRADRDAWRMSYEEQSEIAGCRIEEYRKALQHIVNEWVDEDIYEAAIYPEVAEARALLEGETQ